MKKRDYAISNIYQGSYSTLKPNYFSGSDTYIQAGSLGMTTDPRTANILKEVSSKLSMGVKAMEIEGVTPQVFDSIPKDHLKEVHRLSKLTGVDITLHGPVMDVAGFTRQGYNETERQSAERRVAEVLLRAKDLNPEGNIPVNFHTAEGYPGSEFLPPRERKKADTKYKRLLIVNRDSGQIAPIEVETKFYPGEKEVKKIHYTPEKRMELLNESEWDNQLNQVFFNQERVKEILDKTKVFIQPLMPESGNLDQVDINNLPSETQKKILSETRRAGNYLQDIHQQVNGFFSKAYEFGVDETKNELKKLNQEFFNKIEKNQGIFGQAESMQWLINELKSKKFIPQMWVPLEEFATEKTAQTFGNASFDTYKKLKGKNVPTLVIENPPAGFGLSTGQDVANVVEQSRIQFVENAVREGMDKNQAKKEAEKLIGATWDVGHINMLRKFGYSEEDIIKESEKVAPFIKHVHLSDNFGFEHTELPMGMGNVPLKQIMEKLGQKGFEAKKIIEAGTWWQHFQAPPFQETLEAVGSPIYGMKMAPYWNSAVNLQESYFGGYGMMLPQINYETFGAGFSRLPSELGGSTQSAQGSRMSGRPMQ